MSFSAYGKHRGCSQQAVSQAVKAGRITAHRDPVTGQPYIDPEEADRDWKLNTDPTKQAGSKAVKLRKAPRDGLARGAGSVDDEDEDAVAPDGTPSLAASKRKTEHFKALEREASFLKKIGDLVPADEVKREAFARGRALREAILSVPDRLHTELANETDPNRVHARLTEELIIALEAALAPAEPEQEEQTA